MAMATLSMAKNTTPPTVYKGVGDMDTQWVNIKQLLIEERRYGVMFKIEQYKAMCDKYGFIKATNGWVTTKDIKNIPNLANSIINKDQPDIRDFFSHYYSFGDKHGEIYWVIAPRSYGWTQEQVEYAFKANRITCDVMDGFYGDYVIIMKPKNLVDACSHYVVGKSNNDSRKYALHKINTPMSINTEIKTFDTENEALAFKAGMDYAYQAINDS